MSFDLYTISLPASSPDRPTVTLIMANSLRHGTRAGCSTWQLGLARIVAVVGIGLTSVIELTGHRFDVLRRIGAACAAVDTT
jgi:threonine/homoserine/homoserine lactone efflux protein